MSERVKRYITVIKCVLFGKARDLHDPHLFHNLSLAVFFAWVGLGSDGLSSSCYGPEEAFLALGQHVFLGIFVAIATAITIFIITTSYTQIVELFPNGGGGYVVASKLLSPSVGMVSGCALLVDYVLTITISIASGTDAIFSFLPHSLIVYKLPFAIGGLIVLIIFNLRGVKESVFPLIPIFIVFICTHVFTILYTFFSHFSDLTTFAQSTTTELAKTSSELGFVGMIFLILRAYSMGAGTYTGIEAVSNGLPILREPKVHTAKKTMFYMAVSLAFMAFGLMIGYLVFKVQHVPGKTLNAILLESVTAGWHGNSGYIFLLITLISEALLLFVAAQTGFLDGPRVLANMAVDRWFPFQFALLSERFVIKNGILVMGIFSLAIMLLSRGSVKFLVILYSINVFITFCLSQLGMVWHWWKHHEGAVRWKRKLLINGIGFILTSFILVSITVVKFNEGGWITLLITGSLVVIAIFIKRYYYRTQKLLMKLDKLAHVVEASKNKPFTGKEPAFNKQSKTAVILVNGFNGTGLHIVFSVIKLFADTCKNFIFLETGIVDTGRFKGADAVVELEQKVKSDLERYKVYMQSQGFFVDTFSAIGTDVVDEICAKAEDIYKKYPNCILFGGQIVFKEESYLDKILYNHVTFVAQRRLHQKGIPFLVMPIRAG